MRWTLLIGGTVLMATGTPAAAQSSAVALATSASPIMRPQLDSHYRATTFLSHAFIEQEYRYGLVRLRKAALKQQAADGGELTPASVAELQARLDKLNAVRTRGLSRLQRS